MLRFLKGVLQLARERTAGGWGSLEQAVLLVLLLPTGLLFSCHAASKAKIV